VRARARASDYGPDLAFVHHAGYGEHARGSAAGLLERLRAARLRGGLVIDLGCGSGIWARELLERGYSVLGVDASRAMLALARRTAPGARFVHGSAFEVELPQCAAVTSLGEALGYLPPGAARPPAFLPLFRRVHRALLPGGLFAFDLLVRGRGKPLGFRSWRQGQGWAVLSESREVVERAQLERRIVTFRRSGRTWRRSEELHRVRVADSGGVVEALRSAGFRVSTARNYGAHRLLERRLAFFARKPGRTSAGKRAK